MSVAGVRVMVVAPLRKTLTHTCRASHTLTPCVTCMLLPEACSERGSGQEGKLPQSEAARKRGPVQRQGLLLCSSMASYPVCKVQHAIISETSVLRRKRPKMQCASFCILKPGTATTLQQQRVNWVV